MSYFPPIQPNLIVREPEAVHVAPSNIATRPTRPVISGRISSWDSLDDRIRTPHAPHAPHAAFEPVHSTTTPLDTFERMADGTYRRVGSMSGPTVTVPEHDITVHVPTHRIGWRTVVQIYGVLVAMSTAAIAAYNLYARTHGKEKY